jgi:prevent-host-death family protein
MNTKIMNSDEVRAGWRNVVDDVMSDDTVLVERYNEPVVAVISYADFLAIREQLEDLHDLRLAEAAYAEYKREPSRARPIEELIAEWDAQDAAEEAKQTSD